MGKFTYCLSKRIVDAPGKHGFKFGRRPTEEIKKKKKGGGGVSRAVIGLLATNEKHFMSLN